MPAYAGMIQLPINIHPIIAFLILLLGVVQKAILINSLISLNHLSNIYCDIPNNFNYKLQQHVDRAQ